VEPFTSRTVEKARAGMTTSEGWKTGYSPEPGPDCGNAPS